MDSAKEVQSFLVKFNQLWNSGYNADLHIKCNAGQASLHLEVGLGYATNVDTSHFEIIKQKKNVSPSRLRRRIWRENARKENLVPSENGGDGRNTTDADIAENVTNLIESQTLVTEDAVLDVPSISDDVQNLDKSSELVEEAAETNAVDSNDVITTDLVTDSENVANSKADPTEDRAEEAVMNGQKNEVSKEQNEIVNSLPDIVEVYALASFKNSPHASLTQDDLNSLGRFITSKDHLQRNIARVHYDTISSNGMNSNGTYSYTVQVKILVLRKHLWEGARSYIWKHLGSDIWERGNGTKISLSRIHQK